MEKSLAAAIQKTEDTANVMRILNAVTRLYLSVNVPLSLQMHLLHLLVHRRL